MLLFKISHTNNFRISSQNPDYEKLVVMIHIIQLISHFLIRELNGKNDMVIVSVTIFEKITIE